MNLPIKIALCYHFYQATILQLSVLFGLPGNFVYILPLSLFYSPLIKNNCIFGVTYTPRLF